MQIRNRLLAVIILAIIICSKAFAINVEGKIVDASTKEPIIGATIVINNHPGGTTSDFDGNFVLKNVKEGVYTFTIRYISYQTLVLKDVKVYKGMPKMMIELKEDSKMLSDVTVVARQKHNTENSIIAANKNSLMVQSGVSLQEIKRAQDSNASQVLRRIPGISLIDERFVMVRGLSQRYNNVWINGSAVPSSEADSRAFSFDIIPASQLDNMQIVKSPAPEFPADFSGGFILIKTKDISEKNSFDISIGTGINTATHFKDFYYQRGAISEYFGFDSSLRPLSGGFSAPLKMLNDPLNAVSTMTDLQGNGFYNDWTARSFKPLGNIRLGLSFNRYFKLPNSQKFSIMGNVNYNNSYRSFTSMQNNLFGAYDKTHDKSQYLHQSTDDQYNHDIRLGAMLNLTYIPKQGQTFELRNIFNQIGKSRYTSRSGYSAQSDAERSAEFYYSSRTTYNGQLTGSHVFDRSRLKWALGYAYANRYLPDRKRYLLNDSYNRGHIELQTGNDINREFTKLDEHILSSNITFDKDLNINGFAPNIKVGVYAENRQREYLTRNFIYQWNPAKNSLPKNFTNLPINKLMVPANYGADKLYLFEEVKMTNNYKGLGRLGTGFIAVNLPIGNLDIYTGVRYEYNLLRLTSNTREYEVSPKNKDFIDHGFFPSVNLTYKFDKKNQLRASWGKTINRPEFREVSSSVFYDFDMASDVQGNPNLTYCTIYNTDLRYEYYPSRGEQISFALFAKQFHNPIEWTYTVSGGTDYVYSFQNAKEAYSYGAELDLRKNLGFIGLKDFSLNFNGSLILSKVKFPEGSRERTRPMQGQSPYLVNTALFYNNEKYALSCSLLYNRIGKRIIGVGRSVGTQGGDETLNIPDSYEMPRNVLDFSVSKKFAKHWELALSVRDILNEKVQYKQFDTVKVNGASKDIVQITKEYTPGTTFRLSLKYNF